MIFASDYDGDENEYLAAFGLGIPTGMRWTFGSFAGFPGPCPTRPFQEYVADGESEPLLRFAAYPGATVRDVDMALAVTAHWRELRAATAEGRTGEAEEACCEILRALALVRLDRPPSMLAGVWQALRHRPTVHGLVVAVPVDPGRWRDGGRDRVLGLSGGEGRRDTSPFAEVAGLHFARMTVIRSHLADGGRREHLLMAAWLDGDPVDAAWRLATALTTDRPHGPWADDLWGACAGYPGSDDAQRLAGWLLDHRLKFSLYLDSRAGSTVGEIREALELKRQVEEVVAHLEGYPLSKLAPALTDLAAGDRVIAR